MKKTLSLVLALCLVVALVFALAGCGSDDAADSTATAEAAGSVYSYTWYNASNEVDGSGTYTFTDSKLLASSVANDATGAVIASVAYDETGVNGVISDASANVIGSAVAEYNEAGQLTKITNYDTNSAVTSTVTFTYDEAGTLVQSDTTDASGAWTGCSMFAAA